MKKIIITGATKGIGRAIAEAFAREGFDLAVCARTKTDLDAFQKDMGLRYPNIEILAKTADLSKKEEVTAFANYVKSHWDEVSVLVNNAGHFIPGEIYKEKEGVLEFLMETNLYSAYHLTRAIVPMMLEKQKGHVFNICSIASLFAYPNGGSYSITKFAMLGFSKVLREELKGKGIRVTAILPGATWSDSWAGAKLPEERIMKAEDIASAVLGAWKLSPTAVVEEMVIRPQLGDL